jgi:SAM-dependent methyltransferase
MDPSTEARLKSEAEFHDKAFGEGARQSVGRFYRIIEPSRSHYLDYLGARCAGKRLLEYGSGDATQGPRFVGLGATVVGIDISPVAVEKNREVARRRGLDRLTYEVMDAEATTFPDHSFDLIGGVGILHHLDLRRCYAEIARLLADGGSATFIEPLGHNPLINWFRDRTPHLRTPDEHPLVIDDLRLLREYFGRVDLKFYYLTALGAALLPEGWLCRTALKALNGVDQALFAVLPFLRKHAWAVVLTVAEPRRAA